MKVAASIFTWLEFVVVTIGTFIYLWMLYAAWTFGDVDYSVSGPVAAVVLTIWTIAFVIRLIICIWRQKAANEGNKVACGVCTLLFVSLLGGIFTLCIRNE